MDRDARRLRAGLNRVLATAGSGGYNREAVSAAKASAWTFAVESGRSGFRAARRGLDYTRGLEYPLAYAAARFERPGLRLLDVGAGVDALFARVAVRKAQARVIAVDRLACPGAGRLGRVSPVRADATRLPFADASFDRVTFVSAIEHFEGDGDTRAILEAARVLRPGGLCVLTAPYNAREATDEWREGPLYGRGRPGERLFFERAYDEDALASRLIRPSGMLLVERRYFGEAGASFERFRDRCLAAGLAGKLLLAPFAPLMPLVTRAFFRDLGTEPPPLTAGKAAGKGGGVLLALEKTG
jgi:SAM-dependent methyltransferase